MRAASATTLPAIFRFQRHAKLEEVIQGESDANPAATTYDVRGKNCPDDRCGCESRKNTMTIEESPRSFQTRVGTIGRADRHPHTSRTDTPRFEKVRVECALPNPMGESQLLLAYGIVE